MFTDIGSERLRRIRSVKPGMNKQAGFTIFELLTVIAIIGILAGLIIANVSSARRVARDRRRVGDVQIIHGSIQAFRKEMGSSPASLSDLVPTYLQAVPTDPQGANYTYNRSPGGSCASGTYVVAARLETTGVKDAINDQTCWGGDSPDNQWYVVSGR